MKKIRVSLAQINPTVGDLPGNVKKIISYIRRAKRAGADIVVFPELAVTGYPPEDLLLKPYFIEENIESLDKIIEASKDITAIVGYVDRSDGIYNSAALISNGMLVDVYHKKELPNYSVFDEYRYFRAGRRYPVYNINGINIGINICEDIWIGTGPAKVQALSGAELILNINASPYYMGKASFRESLVKLRALECKAAIVYVNMVGGQDELVFDGGSFVTDNAGNFLAKGNRFIEELLTVDIEVSGRTQETTQRGGRELKMLVAPDEAVDKMKVNLRRNKAKKPVITKKRLKELCEEEKVYNALMLGTKDYVSKNGFKGVVIGMSGGVDSALTVNIAVDALGRENVHGLFMPSQYTSKESREDALGHAKNLGIDVITVPIENVFKSYLKTLAPHFRGMKSGIAEENIQARTRGNLLMAFSNKFGWLVLTTGNKSEMSVGYATLYGDMAGGFAVIKDVPKTLVYALCEWRNIKEGRELIPGRVLWKEPTAELRKDQKDTDSLPPYPLLDPILKAYVEEDKSFAEILKLGCETECAQKVISMIDRSEYKRRQSPPGIKITPKAFGKDRRFPITNKYKNY
ncbi:MAG: NAD+ synthase [Nitrospira sp.]|nr:NAD+ synthase [Nitrospira sp.]